MSEDSYRTEEQIWRTKSKTSGYFLKRQFERPDLNEFYKNMKPEICKKYKQLTKKLFHSVCDKLKKKCFESQNKMSDIFDEEANAHRAHCQYIMKLYQMISSQTIEDPILQKLKEEDEETKRAIEESEKKQYDLIHSYDNDSSNASNNNNNDDVKIASREKEVSELEKNSQKNNLIEKSKRIKSNNNNNNNNNSDKISLLKAKGKHQLDQIKENTVKDKTTGKLEGKLIGDKLTAVSSNKSIEAAATAAAASSKKSVKKSTNNANSTDQNERTDSNQMIEETLNVLDKLKIKRVKIGNADPRTILASDNERLNRGISQNTRRSHDKSDILDKNVSEWMSNSLQSKQIAAASGGFAYSLPSWKSIPTLQQPQQQPQEPMEVENKMLRLLDKQPVATTFDEFQKIFEKFIDSDVSPVGGRVPLYEESNIETNDENLPDHILDTESLTLPPKIDVVEELGILDPNFKEFMKLTLRKKPAARNLTKQTEKLLNSVYSKSKRTAIGKDLDKITNDNSKSTHKGFPNYFKNAKSLRDLNITTSDLKMLDQDQDQDQDTASLGTETTTSTSMYLSPPNRPSDSPKRSIQNTFESIESIESINNENNEHISNDDNNNNNNNNESFSPSPNRPRTLSKGMSSRRRRRAESTSGNNSTATSTAAASLEDSDTIAQTKLQDTWDILQAPTFAKLSFMRKYSTKHMAHEFLKAVDLWAGAAVSVKVRIQLLELLSKAKSGFCIFPMSIDQITKLLEYPRIPESFNIKSLNLLPSSIGSTTSNDWLPLSVKYLSDLKTKIKVYFSNTNQIDSYEQLQEFLVQFIEDPVNLLISNSIHNAFEELNDSIVYAQTTCKEWLIKTKITL